MTQDARRTGPRCQSTRRDGAPCQGAALAGSAYCFAHSPAHAEARAEGAAKGGSHHKKSYRMVQLAPASLKPVVALLFDALEQLAAGEGDPRTATAMATVASAIVRCLTAGELEERVRQLEEEQRERLS